MHDGSQDGVSGGGARRDSRPGLGRQESKGTLGRQGSRGTIRRQQSASRLVEKDSYTQGRTSWKDSLRGSSASNETMKERRGSRSSSVHGQGRQGGNTENGTRRLLDPGQARRWVGK